MQQENDPVISFRSPSNALPNTPPYSDQMADPPVAHAIRRRTTEVNSSLNVPGEQYTNEDPTQPLLPSPNAHRLPEVATSLIPFKGLFGFLWSLATFRWLRHRDHTESTVYAAKMKKKRPLVAGGGTNVPVDIICCLSEWVVNLESRGTVGGESVQPSKPYYTK